MDYLREKNMIITEKKIESIKKIQITYAPPIITCK